MPVGGMDLFGTTPDHSIVARNLHYMGVTRYPRHYLEWCCINFFEELRRFVLVDEEVDEEVDHLDASGSRDGGKSGLLRSSVNQANSGNGHQCQLYSVSGEDSQPYLDPELSTLRPFVSAGSDVQERLGITKMRRKGVLLLQAMVDNHEYVTTPSHQTIIDFNGNVIFRHMSCFTTGHDMLLDYYAKSFLAVGEKEVLVPRLGGFAVYGDRGGGQRHRPRAGRGRPRDGDGEGAGAAGIPSANALSQSDQQVSKSRSKGIDPTVEEVYGEENYKHTMDQINRHLAEKNELRTTPTTEDSYELSPDSTTNTATTSSTTALLEPVEPATHLHATHWSMWSTPLFEGADPWGASANTKNGDDAVRLDHSSAVRHQKQIVRGSAAQIYRRKFTDILRGRPSWWHSLHFREGGGRLVDTTAAEQEVTRLHDQGLSLTSVTPRSLSSTASSQKNSTVVSRLSSEVSSVTSNTVMPVTSISAESADDNSAISATPSTFVTAEEASEPALTPVQAWLTRFEQRDPARSFVIDKRPYREKAGEMPKHFRKPDKATDGGRTRR
jgi:hypothetical protein